MWKSVARSLAFGSLYSVVAAQNPLAGQPPCASSCLSSALSKIGCAATDVACACGPVDTDALPADAIQCLILTCQAQDLITAQGAIASVCSAFSAENPVNTAATTTRAQSSTRTSSSRTSTIPRETGSPGSNSSNSSSPGSPGDGSGSSGGSGSLGAGEKAGIAVGAVVGVGLIAFGAFWLGRRQKKKSSGGASGLATDPPTAEPKTELDARTTAYHGVELGGAPRAEMEAPHGGEPGTLYPTQAGNAPQHAGQLHELDAQPRAYPTR